MSKGTARHQTLQCLYTLNSILYQSRIISILNHADTFHGSTVFIAADLDTGLRTAGMDDLSSADIDCYMVDVTFTVTIEYQISGL